MSEQETERPKKNEEKNTQVKWEVGLGFPNKAPPRQKKHTDKALITYSTDLNQILSEDTATGPVHDFKAQVQFELVSRGLWGAKDV